MKLPKHICLTIYHNENAASYESVEEYILQRGDQGPHWKDEASKAQAIAANEIWEMIWYPETPVGSHHIAAPTLEVLLEYANEEEP